MHRRVRNRAAAIAVRRPGPGAVVSAAVGTRGAIGVFARTKGPAVRVKVQMKVRNVAIVVARAGIGPVPQHVPGLRGLIGVSAQVKVNAPPERW